MRAVVAVLSRSFRRGGGRRGSLALLVVVALVFAVAPAVLASGGDHGACGTEDWVKFDHRGGGAWEVEWSQDALALQTPAPAFEVVEWKEGEPIAITWSHEGGTEPAWVVASVSLKAGTALLSSPGGTLGTATTRVSEGQVPQGISFVVFCFDEEGSDEPTDEPEPTDSEGVLPDDTERPTDEPTEPEVVQPEPTEPTAPSPTDVETGDDTEVLGRTLATTGAAHWALLAAALAALSAGVVLVRRTV